MSQRAFSITGRFFPHFPGAREEPCLVFFGLLGKEQGQKNMKGLGGHCGAHLASELKMPPKEQTSDLSCQTFFFF